MLQKPYKSNQGAWYTGALFHEEAQGTTADFEPLFSLTVERPNRICARKTFVSLGDPTGYKWAMMYLGDYEHWKVLLKCRWFRAAYEEWLNELKVKIRSEALDTIRLIASEGLPAQSLVAAKYLASFEWEKASRGRPSKAELQGELKRAAEVLKVEDDDMERIGLRLVK